MDPEAVALASTAAATLINAMTKDGWEQTKRAVASLWRRRSKTQVPAIEAELEQSRQEALAARPGDETWQDLHAEWRMRLRRLIADDPAAIDEVRRLVARHRVPAHVSFGAATHNGYGHINQAAGDIHIHASRESGTPSPELLAAMDPVHAGRTLDQSPVVQVAWLLGAMPSRAAAYVLPHMTLSRLVAAWHP